MRINDDLDSGIDNEDPMNQNDDKTTPEELSYHFDLQESLKKMYDPNYRYIGAATPGSRFTKAKPTM